MHIYGDRHFRANIIPEKYLKNHLLSIVFYLLTIVY